MASLTKMPRGTRSALNALAASSGLVEGVSYLITDEGRIAVATSASTYETFVKKSEQVTPGVYAHTATENQTTFTITGGYTVGRLMVFLNGILLGSADYTATNGTTVVLSSYAVNGDIFTAWKI